MKTRNPGSNLCKWVQQMGCDLTCSACKMLPSVILSKDNKEMEKYTYILMQRWNLIFRSGFSSPTSFWLNYTVIQSLGKNNFVFSLSFKNVRGSSIHFNFISTHCKAGDNLDLSWVEIRMIQTLLELIWPSLAQTMENCMSLNFCIECLLVFYVPQSGSL